MTLADSIFNAAVADLRRRYPKHVEPLPVIGKRIAKIDTPIVRDMRETFRGLGLVDLLLKHQRVVYAKPAECYDLVEEVLIALGVTSAELLANLQRED